MKLSDLRTFDEVLAEQLRDPEFRAAWEREAAERERDIAGIRAQLAAEQK